MKSYTPIFFLLILAAFTACSPESQDSTETPPSPQINKVTYSPDPMVKAWEMAHEKGQFLSHPVVSYDLDLWWGGKQVTQGKVSLTTDTGKLRFDLENGTSVVFDGDSVYQVPDTAKYRGARFDIFTWPYFFALPYKLNDPGVIWSETPHQELEGETFEAKKLSFEDGTGDSSRDWYIVYADREKQLIRYAAYIVTMYASQAEAEEDPHAVGYSNYKEVEGVPISHTWTFFAWRENEGLTDTLGHANLSNIQFGEEKEGLFERPANAKVITYERPAELVEQ